MSAQVLSEEDREDFLDILDAHSCDIISYYSSYVKIFGCHSTAYLLNYMMDRAYENKNHEFYATDEEICSNTLLNDKQFNISRNKILKLAIFSKSKKGNCYTNTYKLHATTLREAFREIRRGENVK
jgi:predicted nucleic-acid-binding protein